MAFLQPGFSANIRLGFDLFFKQTAKSGVKGLVYEQQSDLHENFKREKQIQLGSPRAFGIVFSVVFLIIAIWQ